MESTILYELIKCYTTNVSILHIKKYRKAEYVQRCVCFVNVQSSLHVNAVFSVCAQIWTMPRILYLSCGIPFPV